MAYLEVFIMAISIVASKGYIPRGSIGEKDAFISEALLRELVAARMDRDLGSSSWDLPGERLAMIVRGNKDLENEQMDYDSLLEGNPNPSLRDQEYMQHSSLWGPQYVAGGAGESYRMPGASQLVKTDAVLPAYCNPPNPCPVGYTEEQGCISDFENTAAYSRAYQAQQHCMCDGEHMFSCPPDSTLDLPFSDKNLVASKLQEDVNPFLTGERLPIAAKKGFDVTVY